MEPLPTPLLLEPQCTTSALSVYGVMYSGVSCLYTIGCFTTLKKEGNLTHCLNGIYNHAITTEHSMTPVQLFTSGVLLSEHGIATIDHSQRISSEFEQELEIPGVSIPRIPPPIPQDDARHLQAIVESLGDQEQNYYGIEVYDTVRALIYERS